MPKINLNVDSEIINFYKRLIEKSNKIKTMTRQELIEGLKKNERAFCFLSPGEKDILRELDPKNLMLLNKDSLFIDIYQFFEIECNVYRIKESYEDEPKPKYIECPIKHGHGHQNMYVEWHGMNLGLHKCCNYPAFMGFEFEDSDALFHSPLRCHYDIITKEYIKKSATHAVFLND